MTQRFTNENVTIDSELSALSQKQVLSPTNTSQITDSNLKQHYSLIGSTLFIKGNLVAKEDTIINGNVEGVIELKNNRLEIGPTARITANIFANVIVISGEIKGDLYASDQVVVTKSGRVFGNIFAANVSMEDGATLKGRIDTEKHEVSVQHSTSIEDPSKTTSLTALFKRVQEIAHINSPNDVTIKNDANITDPQNKTTKEIFPLASDNKKDQLTTLQERSVIGEATLIKGEILADEDVVILGEIEGIIYFKNNLLEVGPKSQIKANIFVKSFISQGEIKGDVYASEQVTIKKLGHFFGNILSPRITIESGSFLTGNIEMEQQNIEKVFSTMLQNSVAKETPHHNTTKSAKITSTSAYGHGKKPLLNREIDKVKPSKTDNFDIN